MKSGPGCYIKVKVEAYEKLYQFMSTFWVDFLCCSNWHDEMNAFINGNQLPFVIGIKSFHVLSMPLPSF